MKIPTSLIVLTIACSSIAGVSGCAALGSKATCAMVLLVEGKHYIPSTSQFTAIERRLGSQFTRRKLTLVPYLDGASHIATIECIPRADAPEMTDLIVRDVAPNSFVSRQRIGAIPTDMPSLKADQLEHQKALSGFSFE